ncbi:MAG: hypothetical protein U1D55_17975 [Phycisphaerae bacterium]
MNTRIRASLITLLVATGCNTIPPEGAGDAVTSSTTMTAGSDNSGGQALVSGFNGRIVPSAAKRLARSAGDDSGFIVVAASNTTQTMYTATTDADGAFELPIPDSEKSGSFSVTVLDPDGHAEGPMLFGGDADHGVTGIVFDGPVTFGDVSLPDHIGDQPLAPGVGNTVTAVDDALLARLGDKGVPVGLASLGKGDDARSTVTDPNNRMDRDGDGLIDLFDADNDGNGVIDDFDGLMDVGALPDKSGLRVNFFMNLKVSDPDSQIFYAGSRATIDAALEELTVITFEVFSDNPATKITDVRLAKSPAPTYLEKMTVSHAVDGRVESVLWSDLNYSFENAGDRWQAFAVAHALIEAGDVFAVEIALDDGSVVEHRRMINYVFTNIPRLIRFGTPTALSDYTSGSVHFDGTQNLVLEFKPPVDETGAYLTGMDYFFEVFFHAADGAQIQDIDFAATWPTPPAGFQQNRAYARSAAELGALSGDSTFTATLPREIFVNSVVRNDGTTTAVTSYQVDIAAQKSGNAALKLQYTK